MVAPGGMHGCSGGHVWLLPGVWVVAPGGMVAPGGVRGCSQGGAWLPPGGCAWLLGGVCMVCCQGGMCINERGGMHPTGMHSCY